MKTDCAAMVKQHAKTKPGKPLRRSGRSTRLTRPTGPIKRTKPTKPTRPRAVKRVLRAGIVSGTSCDMTFKILSRHANGKNGNPAFKKLAQHYYNRVKPVSGRAEQCHDIKLEMFNMIDLMNNQITEDSPVFRSFVKVVFPDGHYDEQGRYQVPIVVNANRLYGVQPTKQAGMANMHQIKPQIQERCKSFEPHALGWQLVWNVGQLGSQHIQLRTAAFWDRNQTCDSASQPADMQHLTWFTWFVGIGTIG